VLFRSARIDRALDEKAQDLFDGNWQQTEEQGDILEGAKP
jgi:hypothetical protein